MNLKTNKMKIAKYLLILTICFFLFINDIQQPIKEETLKYRADKISRPEAKKLILGAIVYFISTCPYALTSGMNFAINWGVLLSDKECTQNTFPFLSGISDMEEGGNYFIEGCADYNYLNKKAVHFCVYSILIGKCETENAAVSSHFTSYYNCSKALKASANLPMLFF